MSLKDEAKSIIINIGGKANIESVSHCATRLRFVVKDKSKINGRAIEDNPDVIKFLESGGQEQVVIGPKVESVYDAVIQETGDESAAGKIDEDHSSEDLKKDWSIKGITNRIFSVLQATFTPILPALAGVGLIKALAIALTGFGLFTTKAPTILILNGIYNAFFYFLPIIISISMAKKFNVDLYIAAAIGASLLEPTMIMKLIGIKGTTFFGIPFSMQNYSSTVFPALIAIPIYAWIYKKLKNWLPDNFHTLIIPFVCLFIMVPFILIIIGPIAVGIGNTFGHWILSLFKVAPALAGLIMGGLWIIIVTFGLHWAIIPLAISNIAVQGSDPIIAAAGASTWACIGIAFGLLIKAKKDPKLRSVMGAALIPLLFAGISEPVIYGALLRYKKCMAWVIIAGAIGGAITAIVNERITVLFFSIVSLQTSVNWIPGTIAGVITALIAFFLILVFGYNSKMEHKNAKA